LLKPLVAAPGLPRSGGFVDVELSEENTIAWLAARAASFGEEGPFNPLLLYGPRGSGKMRLLEAIRGVLASRGRRALLVTVRALAARHASLGRRGRLDRFGGGESRWDALLLAGVEDFAGRPSFASAVARWVEGFLRRDRIVVSTGCEHPRRLPEFEHRLASLLDSGFSARLGPPEPSSAPTLESLAQVCARRLGLLPYEEILASRSRSRLVARARRCFAGEALGAGFSAAEVGRYLGGRTPAAIRRLARRGEGTTEGEG
jgi:hypothetical protein